MTREEQEKNGEDELEDEEEDDEYDIEDDEEGMQHYEEDGEYNDTIKIEGIPIGEELLT